MAAEKAQFAFLDANVYLRLFQLHQGDLAELNKLIKFVDGGLLTLFLPDQVEHEVARRRADILAGILKPLESAVLDIPLPQMYRGSEDFDVLAKNVAAARRSRDQVVRRFHDEARDEQLPADKLIKSLFERCEQIPCQEIIETARTRHALGHPPGKPNSLGDAVSWEALLKAAPRKTTLHLVTGDGDFASPLDREQPNEYLAQEWNRTKHGKLHLHRSLTEFLEARFSGIKLTTDLRKLGLIDELLASGSFQETHELIGKLQRYGEFDFDEAMRILEGGLENDQIRWVSGDKDVGLFMAALIREHGAGMPKLLVSKWQILLAGQGESYAPSPTDREAKAFAKDASHQ